MASAEPMEVDRPDDMSQVEDGALIVLSLKWIKSDDEPQKTKKPETSLQKMLQSWFNKCKPNVDCSVKRILKDGRAVINIKPAPVLTKLQKLNKQTLTGKDGDLVTITSISLTLPSPELDAQIPEDASMNPSASVPDPQTDQVQLGKQSKAVSAGGEQTGASEDALTNHRTFVPAPQTDQVQEGKQSSTVSAGEEICTCSIPVGHFWYVNHMYEEEMKLIEKENGVKIMADVKVRFEEDQKHGRPDRALEEFANLAQKSLVESSGSVIPLKFIDSDQWGDALKTIQKKKNKLLVTLTSETMTVRGPGQSQDVISKCLYADTHWKRNTDASHQEYERETQDTSLKIDVTTKDHLMHMGLTMEESYWKVMITSCSEKIAKIKAKFNVELKESDIGQGKVNVKALYKKDEGNASMESHAVRELFHLYQKTATSPMNVSQSSAATGIWGWSWLWKTIKIGNMDRDTEEPMEVDDQSMQHSALSDNQQHSSPTDTTAAVQHSSLSVNQQHLTPIDTPGAVQPSAMGKNEQHLKPTDTPAAVEDGALIVLSLKWTKSDDEPQKTKKPETSLQKMLQTWFNNCIPNVDCSVKRILKDGSAVINIKPAPAITELLKLSKETLTEKGAGKGKKTTVTITSISLTLPSPELDTQLLTEDDSSVSLPEPQTEQDQQGEQSETGSTAGDQMGASFMPKTKNEHIQPGKESNTGSTTEEDSGTSPMYLQTEQVQVGKQSSRDPAGEEMYTCSVPVGLFWYVSHMYEEEMKLIEKENGVKIMADVKVRFEEDQKHGRPDRALKEFVNLVQKSLVESSGSVIPFKFIESDQWGDALKTIQKKKNKLLVTLTSETMTVRGPGQSQDVISKCLYADTHWKRNTDASHQEYERETQESLKIDMTIKDDFPHAGLIIEKTFWKSMTNSYNKEIEKIKAKFNVAFNDSDIDQGKVNVTALYKKEGNASMESHALRALLCLHQRFVSSQFHGATGFSGTIISQSEGASNEPVLNGQSANRKHNIDPPTDSGKRAGDQSDERCPICLDKFKNKRQLNCKHEFCKDCLKQAEKANGPICPICRVVFGKIVGDQPDGRMSHQILTFPLPGYSDCGTIKISYEISSGTQTAKHPNPGQHYYGISRTAYLPNNKEGNEVLRLLKKAFDQRLIFTIGTSRTTGMDGQVTWNDIHHKTSMSGGAESFGYPDPEYLSRVKEELKAKGIE
ncbi:uncharacterized protein LOC101472302 [Maylandia zebra]|uniref:uncharacterized protein LOC101472302 n=1 Tax=Maylandia zebra TaxID=106582 RepID=UPI00403D2C11